MASKGAQLKALINAPEIVITPGVFDGFSARLIEKAGFKTPPYPVPALRSRV